jgi:hypothetical protein
MKKKFLKMPDFIVKKLDEIKDDNIQVCTILKVNSKKIEKPQYKNIDIKIINGQLTFKSNFIPDESTGIYSRKNVNGYKVKYPDQPKVWKTFYCGERPYFGDWSKGSFSLYVRRKVIPYDNIPPRELSIITSLIKEVTRSDGSTDYIIKVAIDAVFNKNDSDFLDELFFAINLLQENIYSSNVFSAECKRQDYLKNLFVDWEIFPPGSRDQDIDRIIQSKRNPNGEFVKRVEDRYGFLRDFNPQAIINGNSGMRHYFGAQFNENLVVFENSDYGNAMYILFENWETLSKLSRTEIQNRPDHEYIRIPHGKNWKRDVSSVLKDKLR